MLTAFKDWYFLAMVGMLGWAVWPAPHAIVGRAQIGPKVPTVIGPYLLPFPPKVQPRPVNTASTVRHNPGSSRSHYSGGYNHYGGK